MHCEDMILTRVRSIDVAGGVSLRRVAIIRSSLNPVVLGANGPLRYDKRSSPRRFARYSRRLLRLAQVGLFIAD